MPFNPYLWPPEPFLILYCCLLVCAFLFSLVAPAVLRPVGRGTNPTDPAELALLAGGRTRLMEAEAARQLAGGELIMMGKDRFINTGSARRGLPPGEIKWTEFSRRLGPLAMTVETRLRRAGMLVSDDELASLRRWAVMPLAVLAVFGTVRLVRGVWLDHPVGFLALLLAATTILGVIRWGGLDRRTAAGTAALAKARAAADRLRRAPTQPEMALGVALFGTAVLAGSEFERLHQLRAAASGDGGGGGGDGGSGCGGGGCGGGGCGG